VKPGPVESVNCSAYCVAERDTHIELVLNPMDSSAAPRNCGSDAALEGYHGLAGSGVVNTGFCATITWDVG